MGNLLRCELAEHFLNDVALFEAAPDVVQGDSFQRRNIVLNKMSLERSHGEGRGAETLSASR